jgi:hypothetical protein
MNRPKSTQFRVIHGLAKTGLSYKPEASLKPEEEDDDFSIKLLEHQKNLHQKRLKLLREETNNVLNSMKGKSHLTDKTINTSLIHNKTMLNNHSKPHPFKTAVQPKPETQPIEIKKDLNRRKSSVFQDIYEIKRVTNTNTAYQSNGFSKNHLFDVYLDDEAPQPGKRERLPSIINLYNSALKYKLIEKFNPTTVKGFNTMMNNNNNSIKKTSTKNPTFDFKSQSLIFDGVKVKKNPVHTTTTTNRAATSNIYKK